MSFSYILTIILLITGGDITAEACKDIVHEVATGLLEVGIKLQSETGANVELSRYIYLSIYIFNLYTLS